MLSDGSLWVANQGSGTVTRLDPSTGLTQEIVRTGATRAAWRPTAGAVWVADDASGMVERIDARTGAITNTIRVGDAPAAIAATHGRGLGPRSARRDGFASRPAARCARGDVTARRRAGELGSRDRVRLGRGRAGRHAAPTRPPQRFGDEHGQARWASERARCSGRALGRGRRGGPPTTVEARSPRRSYRVIDTIDPAASTSWNVSPPQDLGLTNDGLVTLDHVPGPNGTRLVPDLALSLPVPTDNGRTYAFRLRPGIRYSTGALGQSRATSRTRSSACSRSAPRAHRSYQSITGAAACTQTPSRCDLSRGIVADDRAGTVTFHLTRPDPDFLYKLTIAYADVLPASTPNSEARTPLPATGPYVIARYVPGRELRLIRNPRFREWSAAAQPAGYPDRIVLRSTSAAHRRRRGRCRQGRLHGQYRPDPERYATYFVLASPRPAARQPV